MDASIAGANFARVQEIFGLISGLQLIVHLWPQCNHVEDKATYDFIIAGGGTAGCVIAHELAKHDVKVLLVEAGGTPPLESYYPAYNPYLKHSVNDWNMTSSRDELFQYHKGSRADIAQGKMLGGSSSLNYMVYERGNPGDYEKWARITNDTSWSFKSVFPLFRQNEGLIDSKMLKSPAYRTLYGLQGKINLRKYYNNKTANYFSAFKELGNKIVPDLNEKTTLGFDSILYSTSNEERASTARFLRYPKKKENLDILMNALVTKILFDDKNVAIGVEIKTTDEKIITVKARKEVIISAGVFKTPQLLMLSGIGPKDHLEKMKIKVIKDLPVGENLQEHLMNPLVYRMGEARPDSGLFNPHLLGQRTTLRGRVAMNKPKMLADYEVLSVIYEDPEPFLVMCSILCSFTDEVCNNLVKGSDGKQIFFVLNYLTRPESRGRVLLNTKDIKDQPVINIAYDKDLEMLVNVSLHFNSILNTSYFRSVDAKLIDPKLKKCANFDKNSREYWRCYTESMITVAHYFVGTCAMGQVVDSTLLVKGFKNLRVADASVMPNTVSFSPQATVIMIAEKAAKLIIQKYL